MHAWIMVDMGEKAAFLLRGSIRCNVMYVRRVFPNMYQRLLMSGGET
jgi:hypothetical protein